jgi:hypothetical protein
MTDRWCEEPLTFFFFVAVFSDRSASRLGLRLLPKAYCAAFAAVFSLTFSRSRGVALSADRRAAAWGPETGLHAGVFLTPRWGSVDELASAAEVFLPRERCRADGGASSSGHCGPISSRPQKVIVANRLFGGNGLVANLTALRREVLGL